MPGPKKHPARVLEPRPVPGRDSWRVVVIGPDGGRSARERFPAETGKTEEERAWAYYRTTKAKLDALGEVTVERQIVLYRQRHLLVEKQNKPRSAESAEYRLRYFFASKLKQRLTAVANAATLKQLYLGRYDDRGNLVEHGAVTRPTRPRSKGETEGPPASAASHQNALFAAQTFLDWCVSEQVITTNHAKAIKPVGRRAAGKPKLSGDQTEAFIRFAMDMGRGGDSGAVAALLALVLGLRASEIINLTPQAIDRDATVVKVIRGKTRRAERALRLPVELDVGAFLQSCLKDFAKGLRYDEPVFVGERGQPRARRWVWEAALRVCKLAGLPPVGPHGLRGTHLSLAEEEGTTPEMMLRAAGHGSRAVQHSSYLAPGSTERGTQKRFLARLQVMDGGASKPTDGGKEEPIQWRKRGLRQGGIR